MSLKATHQRIKEVIFFTSQNRNDSVLKFEADKVKFRKYLKSKPFQRGDVVPSTSFARQTQSGLISTDSERSDYKISVKRKVKTKLIDFCFQDCNGDALVTCEDYTMIHKAS